MLSQRNQDGEEHPVAYGSRKLLPREQKYSAIERGTSHCIWNQALPNLPGGNRVPVETDHDQLTQLSNLKDSHGRLARWALTLQPYHFTAVHRSDTANANAAGPSRDQGSRVKEEEVPGKTLTVKLPSASM